MTAKNIIISMAVVLMTVGNSFAQIALPEGTEAFELPFTRNLLFTKNGKVGVGYESEGEFNTLLKAEYDFILPLSKMHHYITLKNGVMSFYNGVSETDMVKGPFKRLEIVKVDGVIKQVLVDRKYTYRYIQDEIDRGYNGALQDGAEWKRELNYRSPSSEYLRASIENLGSGNYLIQSNISGFDQPLYPIPSEEYPGEDSISDLGYVVYYPRVLEQYSGIYNISKDDWSVKPDYNFLFPRQKDIVIHKFNSDSSAFEIGLMNYKFDETLKPKFPWKFNTSDSLSFLPAGAKLHRPIEKNSIELFNTKVYYLLNGKMGLMSFNFESYDPTLIEPTFDLINQVSGAHYLCVKYGQVHLYDILQNKSIHTGQKSIGVFGDRNSGELNLLIDDKTTIRYYEDEERVMQKKTETVAPHEVPFCDIARLEKINSEDYMVRLFNTDRSYYAYEPMQSEMWPGEDSIDNDGNVVYYPILFEDYGNIYNINDEKWLLDRQTSNIETHLNNFVVYRTDRKKDGSEGETSVGLLGKDYKYIVTPKKIEDFTAADTVAFLPEGGSVFRPTYQDENDGYQTELYFKKNGKMGLMEFVLFRKPTVLIDANYDLLVPAQGGIFFLGLNAGKIHLVETRTGKSVLSGYNSLTEVYAGRKFDHIDEYGNEYYTSGNSLISDGKVYDVVYNEKTDNDDLKLSKTKVDNPDEYSSINKIGSGKYLVCVNNLDDEMLPIMSVEWPGEDSIDWEGNVVYYAPTGALMSFLFDANSKKKISQDFHDLKIVDGGIITTTKKLIDGRERLTSGFLNEKFEEVLPAEYAYINQDEDLLIVQTTDWKTGAFDQKGKEVFELTDNIYDLTYKDGFFFSPALPLESFWYPEEDSIDANGDVVYSKSVIQSIDGKTYEVPGSPVELFNEGVVMFSTEMYTRYNYPMSEIGFFDLKSNKVLKEARTTLLEPGSESNKKWIKEDNKWNLYQIGPSMQKLGNNDFDGIDKLSLGYNNSVLRVEKGDKTGLMTMDGKTLIPLKGSVSEGYYLPGDQTAVITRAAGKSGFYSLNQRKYILQPIYDTIAFLEDGTIQVQKYGLHGFINAAYINPDGSFKWTLEPKYKGSIRSAGGYFIVSQPTLTEVIDSSGKVILSGQFDDFQILQTKVDYYSDPGSIPSVFVVTKNTENGKLKGAYYGDKLVIPFEYKEIKRGPSADYLLVGKSVDNDGTAWGLYDYKSAKESIKADKQMFANSLTEDDKIWVKENDLWGLYKLAGDQIINSEYTDVKGRLSYYMSHLNKVLKDGKVGLVNVRTGKELIPCEFDNVDYQNRMINVEKNGKYGLYDPENYFELLPCEYDAISDIGDYAIGKKNGKYDISFIDEGLTNPVVRLEGYPYIGNMSGDILILTQDSAKLLNSYDLDIIIEGPFDYIYTSNFGYYVLTKDGKSGLEYQDRDTAYQILPMEYNVIAPQYSEYLYLVGNKKPWANMDNSVKVGVFDTREMKFVTPMEYTYFSDGYYETYLMKDGKKYTLRDDGTLEEYNED